MSETDDTDDLLLIPPDFFVVHSEPQPPYYSIVDSLIKQVSNLQDRIEGIESMSDVSLISSYQDNLQDAGKSTSMFNSKAPFTKRYYSHDDLYQPSSAQSTPQKLHEKPRINSLPNTPIISRISPRKNSVKFNSPQNIVSNPVSQKPGGEETEMLHEIDTFLSNVKTIQRNHTVRNLHNDFNAVRGPDRNKYPQRNSDLQTCNRDVEETIQELDRQSQRIATESTKEIGNNGSVQERVSRVNTWQCGDNIGTVPDYGAGIRDHLYKQKEAPLKSSHFKPSYQQGSTTTTDFNSTNTTLDKSSDSSSESTQLTAYNRTKKQDFNKFSTKLEAEQKINEQFNNVFKKKGVDIVSPESIDRERNELLHSPLHDNALSVLDMHKKLLESTNAVAKDARMQKKRGINTLSDNLGLVSLADIWGASYLTQSPSKVSQKLQEEKLRRQHCEQLIQELQNKNLELQQKLAVAVNVDDTKNKTIQQFREALDTVSLRMEKLNEEKSTWDRETGRLKKQHSIEIESANQKMAYYEKEATKSLNLAHANQEKLSFLEKRCSDLQLELQQIEMKFKDVQECYEREFEKNKKLADIISQKEIELKENKSVLNNAREEVSHSRKAVEVCQAEFTSLKDECKRLQSDLSEAKSALLTLTEQKRKLLNDIQTYKQNEKTLKEALEQSKLKLESAKLELRNFYQGQLEIIVENKRKEMQSQLDRERQNSLEEVKRKELSMAKTAANHIKDISEKCALETKLLEQKHQEEIRLYQMQLSQTQKEMESLQSKLAQLPEKRAQIAKQLQKVMESQWSEALKMINSSPTPISFEPKNPSKAFNPGTETESQQEQKKDNNRFESVSDYDETPVSSRGAKQSESEIQKYINMLLNRPPGNPISDTQGPPAFQTTATWNPGVSETESENSIQITRPKRRRILESDSSDSESPIQMEEAVQLTEFTDILGSDPSVDSSKHILLSQQVVNRWSTYLRQGLQQDDKTLIKSKWVTPENCPALSAPAVNPEIKEMLSETEIKKDSFLSYIQNDIGAGLTALGVTLDILIKGGNLDDQMKQEILPGLVDSAKLLCNAHFHLSMHRRHQIYPKLKSDMHRVAKESKLDSCLFGEKLIEKFKTNQAIKKSSAEFKAAAASRGSASTSNSKHHLNFPRRTSHTRFKVRNFVRGEKDKIYNSRYQRGPRVTGQNQPSYYRAQSQRFQQRS